LRAVRFGFTVMRSLLARLQSFTSSIYPLMSERPFLLALALCAALAPFSARAAGANELRIGFVPGPYADEFKAGVEPHVEFAAIQGNFAIFSGYKLTDALALEQMTPPYINQVVVRAANKGSRSTQDIVGAYQSPAFQQVILSNHFYDGFRLPEYFASK
jgi:hypothetical protein